MHLSSKDESGMMQSRNSIVPRYITNPIEAFRFQLASNRFLVALKGILAILLPLLLVRASLALKLDLSAATLMSLFLIILIAIRFGFWQASVASVSAVFFQTFFFIPRPLAVHLVSERNLVAIVLFELIAVVVARLSTRERAYAIESKVQQRRTQRLHAVSHNVLLLNLHESPEKQIATFIQREFELDAVAILSDSGGAIGASGLWLTQPHADEKLRKLAATQQPLPGVSRRSIGNAKGQIGSLLILGEVPELLLQSLASLSALALERHKACLNEAAAQESQKAEQMRTTVLDGLAHAFKTPLTIIRAASSGLIEVGHLDEMQSQLTQMIDQQSAKLGELTDNILSTTSAQSEEMRLHLESIDMPALIDEVMLDFQSERTEFAEDAAQDAAMKVCISGEVIRIPGDYDMIALGLQELLNNAVKYSACRSVITISLTYEPHELTLAVKSHGIVIRKQERDRIFEKFYRGIDHRDTAPGTGIGLSVVRRITEAHGGRIWFTSSESAGTTFYQSLPVYRGAEPRTKELR